MKMNLEDGTLTVDLPVEVGDEITAQMILTSYKNMKEDLQKFYDNRAAYLHIDDITDFCRYMEAMKIVYQFYAGEELEDALEEDEEQEQEMPPAALDEEYMRAFLAAIDRT